MDARFLLATLCARHGVEFDRGLRLLPLIRWALEGPESSRDRILSVVERTLSNDGIPDQDHARRFRAAADQAILVAVAGVLHSWSPSDKLLDLDFGMPGGSQ
ncbi:MAG: hypothetical protein ABGY71_03315 [bacterium]|jgi:hypothetical protein|nr:hypothetical protein [Planctomycetota bacterium]HIL53266.1 hypothetical protein [Planctomycetota bacterium]